MMKHTLKNVFQQIFSNSFYMAFNNLNLKKSKRFTILSYIAEVRKKKPDKVEIITAARLLDKDDPCSKI